MKKLYAWMFAVIMICLVGTAILIVLSPDQVPMHYGISGEPDRFGSKYENLLWPALGIVLAVVFAFLAKAQGKKTGAPNEKLFLIAGLGVLVLLTAIGFFSMIKAISYDPKSSGSLSDDILRFENIAFGILFVILGNLMPKARRNSAFGVRTKWSMANDAVWQKSQRFGGITAVVGGLCMIVLSPFVPGMWNLAVLLAAVLALAVLSSYMSYRYYQEYMKNR